MNKEQTQLFDQDAPTIIDDISDIIEATHEEHTYDTNSPVSTEGQVNRMNPVDKFSDSPEATVERDKHKSAKRVVGILAISLVTVGGAFGFGKLFLDAVDAQVQHNQSIDEQYEHPVNNLEEGLPPLDQSEQNN